MAKDLEERGVSTTEHIFFQSKSWTQEPGECQVKECISVQFEQCVCVWPTRQQW